MDVDGMKCVTCTPTTWRVGGLVLLSTLRCLKIGENMMTIIIVARVQGSDTKWTRRKEEIKPIPHVWSDIRMCGVISACMERYERQNRSWWCRWTHKKKWGAHQLLCRVYDHPFSLSLPSFGCFPHNQSGWFFYFSTHVWMSQEVFHLRPFPLSWSTWHCSSLRCSRHFALLPFSTPWLATTIDDNVFFCLFLFSPFFLMEPFFTHELMPVHLTPTHNRNTSDDMELSLPLFEMFVSNEFLTKCASCISILFMNC